MIRKTSVSIIALSFSLALVPVAQINAQIQQILPFNYGVTGVRQDTGGNTLLTGGTDTPSLNTNSAAFLYDGPLGSIPSATNGTGLYLFHYNNDSSNGSQFYGPNTSLFDSSLGAGNIRVVGAYKNAGATYQNSMIYTGPLDGSGTWTNVVAPGNGTNTVGDTILHSTMGNIAVGNYDYTNEPTQGVGFIYNLTDASYSDIKFGLWSTTAYGIWYNGGSKYSIVGGFSDITNGLESIGKAYIVNYDSTTQLFTDFKSFSFNNDPSIVTHFEGISAYSNGFSVCATELVGTNLSASYVFIATNNDGSFDTNVTWRAVTNTVDTNSLVITGDTVIGTNVMGIYNVNGGAYSYQSVPEPTSSVLIGLGGLTVIFLFRRRNA